ADLPDSRIGIAMAQGNVYWAKDYYRTALEKYQQALKLIDSFEKGRFVTFQIMLYGNIAGIYSKLEDFEQALLYAKKSIELGYNSGNVRARGHLKLGTILIDIGAYQEALDSLSITEKFIFQQKDSIALVHCWLAKGMASKELNKIDSAMFYISQSALVANKLDYQIPEILLVEGEVQELKGSSSLALSKYRKALEIAKEKTSLNGQMEAYEKMREWFKKQKRFEEAYNYYALGAALQDSISSVDVINRINELNTKYESEKKEQQISQLESKNLIQSLQAEKDKQARWLLIIAAVALIVIAGLLYFRSKSKSKTNALLDAKNQELAKLNQTKDRLFSIISHDLKSPLSSFHTITKSLSDHWEKLEKDQLKDYIITLRDSSSDVKDMMDNLLKWALSQSNQLHYKPTQVEPKEVVAKIINELGAVSSLKNIPIVLTAISSEEIIADHDFLQIIIRNLLSNALKFSNNDSKVEVTVSATNDHQVLTIQDYGVGMDQEQADQLFAGSIIAQDIQNSTEKGTGLGLVLCKELMEKMSGSIEVTSELGKGTIFRLVFSKAA
ncbi:ATP-binding protein, partial [Reichenbachiella sp.]